MSTGAINKPQVGTTHHHRSRVVQKGARGDAWYKKARVGMRGTKIVRGVGSMAVDSGPMAI